ncbi:MAG: prepilin-type N-terminal cleavage/methylation domain-containing protein [Magnetococcales bacterium]|nr:prepilin-type N-terminal cleavage/methylation domain-containing protein [Magnetococcales bacterium]
MRNEAGYSLLELLVTMIVIGTVAASGSVTFSEGNVALRSAAERFAQDLRYAQTLSMNRGVPHQVNVTGNEYSVTTSSDTSAKISGATLDGVIFGGQFPIVFDGLGRPTSNAGTKTLTMSAQSVTINVRSESGSVIIQ